MIKAYHIFTGADGHSHVIAGQLQMDVFNNATAIRLKETEPHTTSGWHPAPTNQYVLFLKGSLEFSTFTGETFTVNAGEVLIAMDTTGSGHQWKMLGNDPWHRAYVLFDAFEEINFIAT